MKYVIVYPGDYRNEEDTVLSPIEADSKEDAIQKVVNRVAEAKEQGRKRSEYERAFQFSKGARPERPKFGRRGDDFRNEKEKQEVKLALKEHQKKLDEYSELNSLYSKEWSEYMEKCPYGYGPSNYHEPPKLENIYEYPDEFWNRYLNNQED